MTLIPHNIAPIDTEINLPLLLGTSPNKPKKNHDLRREEMASNNSSLNHSSTRIVSLGKTSHSRTLIRTQMVILILMINIETFRIHCTVSPLLYRFPVSFGWLQIASWLRGTCLLVNINHFFTLAQSNPPSTTTNKKEPKKTGRGGDGSLISDERASKTPTHQKWQMHHHPPARDPAPWPKWLECLPNWQRGGDIQDRSP